MDRKIFFDSGPYNQTVRVIDVAIGEELPNSVQFYEDNPNGFVYLKTEKQVRMMHVVDGRNVSRMTQYEFVPRNDLTKDLYSDW
jgi:hypothetical protein